MPWLFGLKIKDEQRVKMFGTGVRNSDSCKPFMCSSFSPGTSAEQLLPGFTVTFHYTAPQNEKQIPLEVRCACACV